MLIHEFPASQSSLFSQATGSAGTIAGGGGRGDVGGAGVGVVASASGEGNGVVEPLMGLMGGSSTEGVLSATGG